MFELVKQKACGCQRNTSSLIVFLWLFVAAVAHVEVLHCFRSLGIRLCLFRQIAGDLSGFSYIYIYIGGSCLLWQLQCDFLFVVYKLLYTLIRKICAWFNFIANIWSIHWICFVWFVGVKKACFTCPVLVPFFKGELFAFKKSMESFQQFGVFKSSVSMAQDFEEDLHVNCNMFVRLCKCRVTNNPYRIYMCIAWGWWCMSRLDDIGYTATYMLSVIGTPLSWGKALEFDLPACWWSEKCVCFQILISESLLNICLCLQYSSFFSAENLF